MLPLLYWPLLLLTCGYALGRGGRYEKVGALICVTASATTLLIHLVSSEQYETVAAGDLLIDCAVLGAFVLLALRSDRFWPLWVAGLQLTTSMAHLIRAADTRLIPQAYAAAERFWSYPILLIVVVGTWRAHRQAHDQDHGSVTT